MALKLLIAAIVLVVLFDAWVRLAPSDPARWHVLPEAVPGDGTGQATRVVPGDADTLARIDAIAMETPRTVRLAGSPAQGMTTYVTRSALWGFPDYITVALVDGQVVLHGRLRFGKSDLGVNAARLDGWLQRLDPVTE